jgi:hypothetical protein
MRAAAGQGCPDYPPSRLTAIHAEPELIGDHASAFGLAISGDLKNMLKDFYVSFSAVCFTLLGLWLIVVQTRHAEWRGSPARRRRVYPPHLAEPRPERQNGRVYSAGFFEDRWRRYPHPPLGRRPAGGRRGSGSSRS